MPEPAVLADRQDRTSEASTSAAVQTASTFQSLGADERVLVGPTLCCYLPLTARFVKSRGTAAALVVL